MDRQTNMYEPIITGNDILNGKDNGKYQIEEIAKFLCKNTLSCTLMDWEDCQRKADCKKVKQQAKTIYEACHRKIYENAEIERLKQSNKNILFVNECVIKQNEELQKQVKQLEETYGEGWAKFYNLGYDKAVKDTAKEIWDDCFDKIMRGCGDDKEFWVVKILVNTFKKFGVEVE